MDKLNKTAIAPYTPGEVHVFGTLASTNDTALQMTNAPHGTVVLAEGQTAGRGRQARSFFSPPACGIYMSVILHREQLQFRPISLVTALAGVAVCQAVEGFGIAPQLKWVNDVYLEGKKVCGILAEGTGAHIVVGIGINFTKPPGGYPGEIAHKAGHLFDTAPMSRNEMVGRVLKYLIQPHNSAGILEAYKSRLMMRGEAVTVHGAQGDYVATVLDVNSQGGLVVRRGDEVLHLVGGEISVSM